MAATTKIPTERFVTLGALVKQRRVALGFTQLQGAKACDLSNQTYVNVEHGRSVSPTSYAKIDNGYGMRAGSCQAVLSGADSITLLDGTELIAGAQIERLPTDTLADDIRAAINSAARMTMPDATHRQTEEMTEVVFEELRKRGILPAGS